MNLKTLTAAVLVAAGFALPVVAQEGELTEEQQISAVQFAVNNTRFVLYHELGHMLSDQLQLPILGKEEDAADNIATYMLLLEESDEADEALADAAYGWLLADLNAGDEIELAEFADEHSLNLQRAFSIVCLMVGNDPEGFAEIADQYEIEPERRESCAFDYGKVEYSVSAVLQPHLGESAGIEVVYDEPDADNMWLMEMLANSGVLERANADLEGIALPNPITIRATMCGDANAWYDPGEPEVVMCYELLEDYLDIIARDMLEPEA